MPVRKQDTSETTRDEDRIIPRFLEEAAPLFLEATELDEQVWEQLRAIAERVGLTSSQLEAIVDVLRRDGVIGNHASSAPRVDIDLEACLVAAAIAAPPSVRPLPPPPPPPPRFRTSESRGPTPSADGAALVRSFLEKVEPILAGQRGMTAHAHVLLADVAHSMGLSESQYDEALRLLGTRTAIDPPTVRPVAERSVSVAPADRFRSYLRTAIREKQASRGYVSESAERKLIEEGTRKLGLSSVFAAQLVEEVAQQCETPILSRKEESRDEVLDPRIEQFIAQAGPIVAHQRGVTPHALILLSSLARDLELSDDQLQRGLQLLQGARRTENKAEQWMEQRREAFREFLQGTLRQLTDTVLTPLAATQLRMQGVQLHGLEPDAATALIRDTAASMQIVVVSIEQAREHLRNIVAEHLTGAGYVSVELHERFIREGHQWGLERDDVEQLIQDECARRRRHRQRERRIVSAAVVVGCLLTVGCMWAFYDQVLSSQINRSATRAARSASPPIEPPSTGSSANGSPLNTPPANQWWDDGMQIAWVNVRRELRQADLAILFGIESKDPRSRGKAYERLADLAIEEITESDSRSLSDFTLRCLALDPSDEAAERLLRRLAERLPKRDAPLPASVGEYAPMLAAMSLLAGAGHHAEVSEARAAQINSVVQATLPAIPTVDAGTGGAERAYRAELLRQLYRNLTAAAESEPVGNVAHHMQWLHPLLLRALEPHEVARLSADLLRVVLPRAGDEWRRFETLMKNTVFAEDVVGVVRMVDVFEKIEDEEARRYLAALLVARSDVSFADFDSIDDVPKLVRERLGVASDPTLTRDDQVALYVEQAQRLLNESADASDVEQRVRRILRLARHATLGLALTRNDMETFAAVSGLGEQPWDAELQAARAAKAAGSSSPSPLASRDLVERSTPLPLRSEQLSQAAAHLRRANTAGPQRLWALQVICAAASTSPESMPAELADEMARYLLSERNPAEHRERLAYVARLRPWLGLRIAIAHEVPDVLPTSQQARDVLVEFLELPADEFAAEVDWPKKLRVRMLQESLVRLPRPDSVSPEHTLYDHLARHLQVQYAFQAQIYGVVRDRIESAETAADLRGLMLEAHATELLARGDVAARAPHYVRDATHRILAAEYAAENNLALTVMLDREWIRLLGWEHDALAGEGDVAGPIARQLESSDRDASDLVEQLERGQEALIRLCLVKLRTQ